MLIGRNEKETEKLRNIEKMVDRILSKKQHLSHSSFSAFLKSPAHYYNYRFGEKTTTNDKEFGKLFDLFLLEPEKFKVKYTSYNKEDRPIPESTMAKKENKDWLRELKDEANTAGKILVEYKDIAYSKEMAESVHGCQRAMNLLSLCDETQGKLEFVYQGFKWLGYKDRSGSELTLDLKTTASAEKRKLKQSVYNYGYHRQGVLYNIGDGDISKPYFILAIEKKPPFAMSVHHLNKEILLQAKNQIDRGLVKFRECLVEPTLFLQSYEFWASKTHGIYEMSAY